MGLAEAMNHSILVLGLLSPRPATSRLHLVDACFQGLQFMEFHLLLSGLDKAVLGTSFVDFQLVFVKLAPPLRWN